MIRRRIIRAAETEPWLRADVQAQRIASADWGENHPGFCYEFGDPNGDPFIPTEVLEAVFTQERFVAVVWQDDGITKVDVSHNPQRTFSPRRYLDPRGKEDGCDVAYYTSVRGELLLKGEDENLDPRKVMYGLAVALRVPLGYPLDDEEQTLLASTAPIKRVLIEFPYEHEREPWPLDTGITAMGAIASRHYLNTIYGSPQV